MAVTMYCTLCGKSSGEVNAVDAIDWSNTHECTPQTPLEMPSDEKFAAFGKFVAALFGTAYEWDSDITQDVGNESKHLLGFSVGEQTPRTFDLWRRLADEVGVYYEKERDH